MSMTALRFAIERGCRRCSQLDSSGPRMGPCPSGRPLLLRDISDSVTHTVCDGCSGCAACALPMASHGHLSLLVLCFEDTESGSDSLLG